MRSSYFLWDSNSRPKIRRRLLTLALTDRVLKEDLREILNSSNNMCTIVDSVLSNILNLQDLYSVHRPKPPRLYVQSTKSTCQESESPSKGRLLLRAKTWTPGDSNSTHLAESIY